MKRAIIYGYGRNTKTWFENNPLFYKWITERYSILSVVDADSAKHGEAISWAKNKKVTNIDEIRNIESDRYIITPMALFDDIKGMLIFQYGIDEKKIESLNDIVMLFFDDRFQFSRAIGKGLEVGGPSFVFSGIYNHCETCDGVNFSADTIWGDNSNTNYSYNGKVLGKQFILDAVSLHSIPNEKYDFYISSNNLEHIANPMKALKEAYRVLKNGGIMIIVVPNRDETFDHNRDFTSFDHMLLDFENDIQESDLSHLKDIVDLHDYEMDVQCNGKENFIERAKRNYENRCLHHHVFSKDSLRQLFKFFLMDTLLVDEMGDNYVIVGRKMIEGN